MSPGITNHKSLLTAALAAQRHTATQRAGACPDFAHFGIAFPSHLGIPARFVSGYAYPSRRFDLGILSETLGYKLGFGRL
jgi:transglutaminase-like putative cysteine protease